MPEDLVIHIPMLRRRAMALVRNQDRADDLVQDTLLRALESNHQYSERGLLKAWLCTVMRNLFISNLRRDKWVTYTDEPPERSSPSTQEDGILLEEALSELSSLPKEQAFAILALAHGHSYNSAASLAGCAVGTVKSRVHRARAEMKL